MTEQKEIKWILYKHTSSFEMMKKLAVDLKENCYKRLDKTEKHKMQERLASMNLYKSRNPETLPLDAMNHRINTLEYYMFGYELKDNEKRNFIFSPLGNLFLKHINDDTKLSYVFASMLFAIQFSHWANKNSSKFQLYPFRLLLQLMMDNRLDNKLYSTEYAYLVCFTETVDSDIYDSLVDKILKFRSLSNEEQFQLLQKNEHTSVNAIFEWQYYTLRVLQSAGIVNVVSGENIGKLYHPQKTGSKSKPTGRLVKDCYSQISDNLKDFVSIMLKEYDIFQKPLRFDDPTRLQVDIVKEMYSFYPIKLLEYLCDDSERIQYDVLNLPALIDEYSNNPENETALLFENVLKDGFNMFFNVDAHNLGGPGQTDVECLFITEKFKFAVEAKSTTNKLLGINSGRLREHREKIGGKYSIVVTPRYVPAASRDIVDQDIVIILAHTLSEYLYNNINHGVRDIDYSEINNIIKDNMGKDISRKISELTMKKFATYAN